MTELSGGTSPCAMPGAPERRSTTSADRTEEEELLLRTVDAVERMAGSLRAIETVLMDMAVLLAQAMPPRESTAARVVRVRMVE